MVIKMQAKVLYPQHHLAEKNKTKRKLEFIRMQILEILICRAPNVQFGMPLQAMTPGRTKRIISSCPDKKFHSGPNQRAENGKIMAKITNTNSNLETSL